MLLDFVHAKFHLKYMLTKRVEMKKKEKLGVCEVNKTKSIVKFNLLTVLET